MNLLCIRFKRSGCYKYPTFEIVVVKKKSRRQTGKILQKIGFFNPNISENFFFINSFSLGFWLNRGAKINVSVLKHLSKFLVLQEEKNL